MKYVNVESVEAGECLGKTVYSGNGTVLLSAGVQLTVFMINTLKRIGVTMLYIQDEAYKDVETEDILDEATKRAIINEMSVTLEAVRSGKDWSPKKVALSIDKLLNDVLNGRELLVQLTDIRTKDNAQYVHAMNVCLLSSVMGLNLGLNYNQLKDLAVGALLHDIGKVGEPPGSASAANASLHHTWRGLKSSSPSGSSICSWPIRLFSTMSMWMVPGCREALWARTFICLPKLSLPPISMII